MANNFAPDYIDVAERKRQLFAKYPNASLRGVFQILTIGDSTFVAYVAECFRTPDDVAPGIGSAWEPVPGKTPYTRDSELQNAETSAWGRAIEAVGAADSKRIASSDEVRNRDEAAGVANECAECHMRGGKHMARCSRHAEKGQSGVSSASGEVVDDTPTDRPIIPPAPAVSKAKLADANARFVALGQPLREQCAQEALDLDLPRMDRSNAEQFAKWLNLIAFYEVVLEKADA